MTSQAKLIGNLKWEETLLERRRWINRRLYETRAKRRALLDAIGGAPKQRARATGTAREVTDGQSNRVPSAETITADRPASKSKPGGCNHE